MKFSAKKKKLCGFAVAFAAAASALFAFWTWAFPRIFVFDESALERRVPATVFRDCRGNVLHVEPGGDYELRFPVSVKSLPPHLIRIVLAAEDRNFFEHDGVDVLAAMRAGTQLLSSGRIVSGASTLTMQLVALDRPRERSFLRKLVQMGEARNLELRWSKEKILEEYLNRLPYGGKIYGIEAAARYYFGRSASELGVAESVMLAGIPQRPNRLRPDRFPEAARERRLCVLKMLERQGVFSPEEAAAVRDAPLHFRNFSEPVFPRARNPQFFQFVRKSVPAVRGDCVTTLDSGIQEIAEAAVLAALGDCASVRDGAAVVVENKTRALRAFLGTADFLEPDTGQVNAATALRSPGSLLKPFIFGEAINGGLLVAGTCVDDSPLTFDGYRPGNFSGTFSGNVSAEEALSRSLNTPAVRILNELGAARALDVLKKFGMIFSERTNAENVGLSLALGGAETTLHSIAGAYAALASGGVPAPLRCVEEDGNAPVGSRTPVWRAGTAEMVLKMLRASPLAGAETLGAAWKTGTSNGLRDAWCVAVTPEWTVAVWFGNKDGGSAAELVGAEIAAPVAGRILNALYRNGVPAAWSGEAFFREIPLCGKTGLAAGEFCRETRGGEAVVGVPLRRCSACGNADFRERFSEPTRILEPLGGVYRCGGRERVRLVVRSVPAQAHWYLDGEYLGFLKSGEVLELPAGTHEFFVWGGENFSSASLTVSVKP